MDVDSLVRHDLPVVMVVGNNGIWGLEKHPMQAIYGWDVACDLQPGCRYDEVVRGARRRRRDRRRPGRDRPGARPRLRLRRALPGQRAHRPHRRLPAARRTSPENVVRLAALRSPPARWRSRPRVVASARDFGGPTGRVVLQASQHACPDCIAGDPGGAWPAIAHRVPRPCRNRGGWLAGIGSGSAPAAPADPPTSSFARKRVTVDEDPVTLPAATSPRSSETETVNMPGGRRPSREWPPLRPRHRPP